MFYNILNLFVICIIGLITISSSKIFDYSDSIINIDTTNGTNYHVLFDQFLKDFKKIYDSTEYVRRLETFTSNVNHIRLHNAQEISYKLGINQFADMTPAEFIQYNGLQIRSIRSRGCQKQLTVATYSDSINWITKGAVTSVKDQGQCGSCWSFSTTGALEGLYKLTYDKLISFSEQQLVDCSKMNSGCDGGLMDYAFNYVMENGLDDESNYPYISGITKKANICNLTSVIINSKIANCEDVEPNEVALAKAVSVQPVSVAIEADIKSFQLYKSGIYSDVKCGNNLDHGVLVVGYGSENNQLYWLVKNSWSENWGENGYIRILRTIDSTSTGLCGIALSASYPIY